MPMDVKNLDQYGSAPLEWARILGKLDGYAAGPGSTAWIATTRPDGRPHLAGVGALWLDERFYVVSGPGTRKSRNIAANPACAISASLKGVDVVVEGRARRVTDDATLQRVAKRYNDVGWPTSVEGDAFTAPFTAPSGGPPPWWLFEILPLTVFAVASEEPFGATRWRFGG